MTATRRCFVYRTFDSHGRLLYIGSTVNLTTRFRGHEHDQSPWLPFLAFVDVEEFATESDARSAEIVAIIREEPHYNIAAQGHRRRRNIPIDPLPTLPQRLLNLPITLVPAA